MPIRRTSFRLRAMYSLFVRLEAANLGFFLRVGADQARSREVFLGAGGDIGEHGLNALEAFVNRLPKYCTTMLTIGSGRNAHIVSLGLMRDHEDQCAGGEHDGVGGVHDPGPSSMRTAFRSLVARAMTSPVRVR